ncbi:MULTISPECIES: serine/threonine-protein kinase [Tsukamurella]|uniref:non-specific serine/threonine protein kinase n=2 Tax=Tsukamurella TaxID=2060 RepID=A0A5C5S2K5_9ACTN|nr:MULTISPECIES: serine/threonine-protein kinase [Tsukamurella]NMD57169.1 protein kinase [Tsukamurella columbiensis]TWS29324.1 protein kinase [Tsukamurella conjunctivitidis]
MGEGTRSGSTLGPYEIGRLLGRGGMGEVYLAHDGQRDRDVALKLLHASAAEDPQFRERFSRESQTVARLADPHVIPIHDFGEIDGVLFIDMRLVEGRNLAEVLHDGPLPPERAVALIEQVAGALDAAHAKGLVHRDVKPANIELTESGFPYLLDFGLAVADTQSRMTSAGLFVGSQAYAAPERFDGDSATVASDVYSLACVLYEALTGRAPYRGESLGAMLKQHLTAAIPRPSAAAPVPPAMDTVVARGMAKDPVDRFGSCGDLARAAREALSGHSVDVPLPSPAYDRTLIRPLAEPSDPTVISQPQPPADSHPTVVSQPSQPHSYPQGASYPSAPSYPAARSYPAAPAYQQAPPPGRSRAVPILSVVAAVLVGATAVLGYVALSGRKTAPAAQTGAAAATATATVTAPAQTTADAPPTTTTTTVTPNPLAALQARAAADRPVVLAALNNRWVPQLASKFSGAFDDGKTWLEADILGEIAYFDQRFGDIRVLQSGEWPVFERRDSWVPVYAGQSWETYEPALAWCRAQGLDSGHCVAKLISTTAGPVGTTKS